MNKTVSLETTNPARSRDARKMAALTIIALNRDGERRRIERVSGDTFAYTTISSTTYVTAAVAVAVAAATAATTTTTTTTTTPTTPKINIHLPTLLLLLLLL